MKVIPFTKHTNCGNCFVIIDETVRDYLSEQEKVFFAKKARDVFFGIGSDGLIVIQSLRGDKLQSIQDAFGYWQKLPVIRDGNYIFRLFESKGKEAFCCGNGLLCIADYMYQHYNLEKVSIITEIPLPQPRCITIGYNKDENKSWCNIGWPRLTPRNVVHLQERNEDSECYDFIDNIKIEFRAHDLYPYSDSTTLILSGHLIYTGEPHLVIFPDNCLPSQLVDTLFFSVGENSKEKRRNFGSWLVSHIGAYINRNYRRLFPEGVNVDFAQIIRSTGVIQYRCYERGINRETLACGTGALAVSCIAKELQLYSESKFILLPHRCNWYQPNTYQQVESTENGWILSGNPLPLFNGEFYFELSSNYTEDKNSILWGMLNEPNREKYRLE